MFSPSIHLFRRLHGTPHGLDDFHLFYYISKFGATVVIPIALLFEGIPLFRILRNAMPEPTSFEPLMVTSKIVARNIVNHAANTTTRMLQEGGIDSSSNSHEVERILEVDGSMDGGGNASSALFRGD